jgi:hypothetical protein
MRKRSKYKPRPALLTPPSFGMTEQTVAELDLVDEAALGALLQHEATSGDIAQLEASCASAIHAVNYAQANPGTHTLDVACLGPVREALLDCAAAVLGVRGRFRTTGKAGCTDEEREALKDLVGHLRTLRRGLPRRVWRAGLRLADQQVPIPVPRQLAEQNLGATL